MGCFVVAEFILTSASRGPSAIAEPLVSNGTTPDKWHRVSYKLDASYINKPNISIQSSEHMENTKLHAFVIYISPLM